MSDEELSPEEALLKRQRKEKKDLQVYLEICCFFYTMVDVEKLETSLSIFHTIRVKN